MDNPKMTKEEYRKVVNKGRRWLMEYLVDVAEDSTMSPDVKRKLFMIMGKEYRYLMRKDEDFFWMVNGFCSKRRVKKEKAAFCRKIVEKMVRSGQIRREMAKQHPDIYWID